MIGIIKQRAEGLREEGDKSTLYSELAILLAEMKMFKEARLVADKCIHSDHRLDAYTAILREYLLEKNSGLEKNWSVPGLAQNQAEAPEQIRVIPETQLRD